MLIPMNGASAPVVADMAEHCVSRPAGVGIGKQDFIGPL